MPTIITTHMIIIKGPKDMPNQGIPLQGIHHQSMVASISSAPPSDPAQRVAGRHQSPSSPRVPMSTFT
jgi:hypothetical protein